MASLDFDKEKQVFRDFYNEEHNLLERAKDALIAIFNSILTEDFAISAITGRVKEKEECIKKFALKYQTKLEEEKNDYEIKEHISDLIGLRVVSLYESDIEKIKNILAEEFEIVDITNKIEAMESKEDSFGYKGLHVDLKLNNPRNEMREYIRYAGFVFEIQIRTIVQDAWSVLDHEIKYKKSIPHHLKRRINTLAALFELADREFYSIREETLKIEEAEKEKSKNELSETDQLNAFSFLAILDEKFPNYSFIPHKIDGFVSEIIGFGNLSPSKAKSIIDADFDVVEKYKNHLGDNEKQRHALNPYTEIRHILYKSDKEKFERILYNDQRARFESWLTESKE